MLVLTRKANQSICIGDEVVVSVTKIKGNTIQLGITAPKDIAIVRSELLIKDQLTSDQLQKQQQSETKESTNWLPFDQHAPIQKRADPSLGAWRATNSRQSLHTALPAS